MGSSKNPAIFHSYSLLTFHSGSSNKYFQFELQDESDVFHLRKNKFILISRFFLSLPSSLSLPRVLSFFYFSPPCRPLFSPLLPYPHSIPITPSSSSLSAVFITHRRHGARLHYTHIHSAVAPLEKSGIGSLVETDESSLSLPFTVAPPLPVSSSSSSCISCFFPRVTLFQHFSGMFARWMIGMSAAKERDGQEEREERRERERARRRERSPFFRFSLSGRNRSRGSNQYEATVEIYCGRAELRASTRGSVFPNTANTRFSSVAFRKEAILSGLASVKRQRHKERENERQNEREREREKSPADNPSDTRKYGGKREKRVAMPN